MCRVGTPVAAGSRSALVRAVCLNLAHDRGGRPIGWCSPSASWGNCWESCFAVGWRRFAGLPRRVRLSPSVSVTPSSYDPAASWQVVAQALINLDRASRFRLHSGTTCCTDTTCVPQNLWSIGRPPSSVHPRGLWQQAALLPAPRHFWHPPRPFAWLCISFALSSLLFRRTTWLGWALMRIIKPVLVVADEPGRCAAVILTSAAVQIRAESL